MDKSVKTTWIVLGVIVVVLIIFGVYAGSRRQAGTGTSPTPSPTGSVRGANTNNRLVVNNQLPGGVVYISSMTLDKDGFVVVRAEENGQPGKVIGMKYFKAGTMPGTINLSTATAADKNYYVEIHEDNGDGIFDESKDKIAKDAGGNDIVVKFKATNQPEYFKG